MQSTTQDNSTKLHSALTSAVLAAACDNAFESILITTAVKTNNGYPIVYVNQAFTALTGYETEEVIGKTPGIL